MKPGAVLVDLAVEAGGNCPLTQPGKVVRKGNVTLVGHLNIPARVPETTSQLFARNIVNLLSQFTQKQDGKPNGQFIADREDEILKDSMVVQGGQVTDPDLRTQVTALGKQAPTKEAPAKKAPAKKTPAKKTPAKKTPAKKTPAKKHPPKNARQKSAPKKAPGQKNTAKKAPPKKHPLKTAR